MGLGGVADGSAQGRERVDAPVGLPLICPACLANCASEFALDSELQCASCGAVYPSRDGIPLLLAEAELRAAIARGAMPADSRAAFYHNESAYLREAPGGREEIERALARIGARGIVLEIGSGAGAFAGLGAHDYCALDYSFSWLQAHLRGYRSICASAEAIPLASLSCRFIFSVATLEHVPRPDLAFAEIDRLLAPGGVAYLAPAWHCRPWHAEGLPVRPYRDLEIGQKLRKALVPLRNSRAYRGLTQLPRRAARRAAAAMRREPTSLHFRQLEGNYETFWMSDSDACSAIDSHEGILFFESRGYEIITPSGGRLRRLFSGGGAVTVRKADGCKPSSSSSG